ncbi:hypothetical protein FRC03_009797 [Tulasnella sp. 419]|nr:hypothetical protein FRC02_003669 [Tulasnella sp. 418]KAG8967544.1 hypothetical protein FRC03_009797 [Tulasnella sp. 419]
MTILGIGVDILHVGRFSELILRRSPSRLAKRILSQQEWIEWNNLPNDKSSKTSYLAKRWASKEAAYKALFPVHKLTWKDITLSRSKQHPKPMLNFSEEAKIHITRPIKFHTSISHDGDYLISQVLVEEENGSENS